MTLNHTDPGPQEALFDRGQLRPAPNRNNPDHQQQTQSSKTPERDATDLSETSRTDHTNIGIIA